jgi:hypothetical protein
MEEIFRNLEESLLTNEVRTSYEKLDVLLHSEFIEYGSSGKVYTKSDVLERLPASSPLKYVLSSFEVFELAEDLVQTRFVTDRENTDGGHTVSLRSSLWKIENGDWKMYFHQGTPTELV